ncbi:MAG: PAS domain-containing protein [Deltaproteobacteria bacterium]|nr:PAS domain-containing protein [Deltaproteobacteria bacterium]
MMRIKTFLFSLRGKAIIAATLFVVAFMGLIGYAVLSREKALYLKDRENQARVLAETAGINFTNAILYQEVGLVEESGIIDRYIADLLHKKEDILTIIIFDNTGMVMAHCHLFEHGKFYENAKEVIAHEATLVREVKNKDRGPILEAITPLMVGERRIATLRIEFSLKDFYEKLTNLGKRIFLLTIAAISGSTFLMVLGINAMVRPIRRLSKAMDSIDYGKYDSISDVPRRDEIGYLQKSFASMVKRLKEADLQWENTFNSITDLVTIHDMDFRIVKANTALAQRLGIATDELKGRKCWEVFHNGSGPFPTCPHAATLKTGEPATIEMEYSHMEGIFLTTTFPVLNERKEVVGTVHVAKDITQEKRFQEKLIQSEKMAAMGQMASGIAHEINNPLNSILGYATYLLEETQDNAQGREELDRIVRAAKRCKETVKRFLDFSRETPKSMEPLNIKEVLKDVLSMCHHTISSQKIEVTEDIGTDLLINGAKGQIEEVFVNLVLNACQAMDNGGELTIKAYRDNGWIKVQVADTGCGIPQENLIKILDPFFTTKEPGKGTGLGLAVSHTIIKNHGGNIDCNSIVGKGTTFIITLPENKYAL